MKEYQQARKYLDSFINYENKVLFSYKKSLKLERVKYFLEDLGLPYQTLRVIHIAGTKGKGSTATMCADLLAAAGFSVGLYTSPHFFDFRERIVIKYVGDGLVPSRIKSEMIPKSEIVRIVGEMKPYLEKRKGFGQLTFFEVYTAVALKYFIEREVDFAVLETGMGGRLDATNVVNALVSVITTIGYDHTDKLGTRLSNIAYEKAGIIKKGSLVVSSRQRSSVYDVIKDRCKKLNSDLFLFGRDFGVESVKLNNSYTKFDFKFGAFYCQNVKIPLKGTHQVENAALCLAAVKLLKENKVLEREIDFKRGLSHTFIEGRFQVVRKNPLTVMDIAHNEPSFLVLRENVKLYFPDKEVILIFAASQDKNIAKMLEIMRCRHLILTEFRNQRCASARGIKKKYNLKNAFIAKNVSKALKIARQLYNKDSLVLISGSLFLVSEAKKVVSRFLRARARKG
ncbi:MAG: bifunctional folylpolyglutamate synthase/dihydrofolate synthase [Candidatus Omnitrophota bacterium]|nr:MAG: bifunctional folylpolyglutamate synthase/dihydrofolate synthase [Candidatus Omnitrophota bacterium]